MSNNNFGGFMEFCPKGLNPFKIQASLKFDLFPGFFNSTPEGFGSWANNESCRF
jgi:hypothetical protein